MTCHCDVIEQSLAMLVGNTLDTVYTVCGEYSSAQSARVVQIACARDKSKIRRMVLALAH